MGGLRISRVLTVVALLLASLGASAWVLWREDLRFQLPTPRPAGLRQPELLTRPQFPARLRLTRQPVLLHFFNPDCPCSRFNAPHVRELVAAYAGRVRVLGVLEGEFDAAWSKDLGGIELVDDADGAIAAAAGVYSTPQAALLDGEGQLRFRGNYNKARYCEDRDSQYARLAIESLLQGTTASLPEEATRAYGCAVQASR